jgi:hypothetical protein
VPDTYPTKKEIRARERVEPDWHTGIRRDKRGGIRIPDAHDSLLRLAPSGSRHLALQIEESQEYQAGVILDQSRAQWLARQLLAWVETGQIGREGTEDRQT